MHGTSFSYACTAFNTALQLVCFFILSLLQSFLHIILKLIFLKYHYIILSTFYLCKDIPPAMPLLPMPMKYQFSFFQIPDQILYPFRGLWPQNPYWFFPSINSCYSSVTVSLLWHLLLPTQQYSGSLTHTPNLALTKCMFFLGRLI